MPVWVYTLIPVAAAIVGAAAAVLFRPGRVLVSAVQHFAAGVVFAAAASEILPGLKHAGAALPVAIGGALGVAVMLAVKQVEDWLTGPVGLLAAIGIDILIDGIVLGIAFVAGERAGILLTIALSIEVLFLGVTVASELGKLAGSKLRAIGLTSAVILLLPVGALLGGPIGALPPAVVTGFFAFGLVALLYLVTEELLVEAHKVEDRPWITAMFFAGFLLLLLLEEGLG